MSPQKFDATLAQKLIHDDQTSEEAQRIVEEEIIPAIDRVLDQGAAELAESTGLPKHLVRLSIAHRLRYAARAFEKLEASRARFDGASQVDIARATGRNPSNVRRVYPQIDELLRDLETGKPKIVVDGIPFTP